MKTITKIWKQENLKAKEQLKIKKKLSNESRRAK
jgi:hypothetical protein